MSKKIKILSIFGTRPEAIKMYPVIQEMDKHPHKISNRVCVTGQHRELLDDVLRLFDIHPDYDLQIMERDQSLEDLVSLNLTGLKPILQSENPDWVLVQGDTATAMAASLAAFYSKIRVGHIEAGLRTDDYWAPFPEEAHRRMISCLSSCHFAPTKNARENLIAEGIPAENILVTGNTGIDALLKTIRAPRGQKKYPKKTERTIADLIPPQGSKKIILVTVHRRENHGEPLKKICRALMKLAEGDVRIVFIVHPNPSISKPVRSMLSETANIVLLEPMDYLSFTRLMDHAYVILTDSGGIQEEAPALGKPLLILREKTERYEAVSLGSGTLVGAQPGRIISEVNQLIRDEEYYSRAAVPTFPYGDGRAAKRIVDYFLGNSPEPFPGKQLRG